MATCRSRHSLLDTIRSAVDSLRSALEGVRDGEGGWVKRRVVGDRSREGVQGSL